MTIQTIQTQPFTMNRLDRHHADIETRTFPNERLALAAANEEVLWESTAWVTVTDERTGTEIFDEKGSFVVNSAYIPRNRIGS